MIYESKVLNGITSLYLREADLFMEPDDIKEARKIPETLSVHMLMRSFSTKIKFVQCNILVHNLLLLSFDIDQTCVFCKSHYEGKNWMASVGHF